jgi:hypothetical protein
MRERRVSGYRGSEGCEATDAGRASHSWTACQPAYPTELRSDIVAPMDPGESEPVRVSRGVRNLLAVMGVLLLVPSLAVVAWAIWNHAEPRGLLTIVPGGLLLGLVLIVFAIRAGK